MSQIKRLIAIEWLKFFIGSVFLLFILVSIGVLVSGLLRSNVTTQEVFFNYLIDLPESFNKIFPISSLIASMFSINKLKNRNELTAIFASGFSRKDFIITIVQTSMFVAFLQFYNAAFLQPFAQKNKNMLIEDFDKKFKNLQGQGLHASTVDSGLLWYKSEKYYISFAAFDYKQQTIINPTLYFYDDKYLLNQVISASSFTYSQNRWLGKNIQTINSLNIEGFPNLSNHNNTVINISEKPSDFKKIESDITTLSFFPLLDYVNNLKKSGINTSEYEVMFWNKISLSFICILMALLASVGIFSPNRRSSSFGKNIIFILAFTIIYWFIYSYAIEAGRSTKVNPVLSCFIIPIAFTAYLSLVFFRNRKLRG